MIDTDPEGKDRLQQDWQTIWQSELAAQAVDREVLEGMAVTARYMSTVMMVCQELMHGGEARGDVEGSDPKPASRTRAPPGPTPAGAASGVGDPEIERLRQRVAELERRLAEPFRKTVAAKRNKPGT